MVERAQEDVDGISISNELTNAARSKDGRETDEVS